MSRLRVTVGPVLAALMVVPAAALAQQSACGGLPNHAAVKAALQAAVSKSDGNGGLSNDMWATVVNADGNVCVVAFSGTERSDQWLASRVISAQKANTANGLSLPSGRGGAIPGLALSTANLYSAVQPGGTLFGLQESNPVDPAVAYAGNASRYGQANDPMIGSKIGGINVFGGGLALYAPNGSRVGGIGVSGDTSCTDHIVAWKARHALNLDNVPAGVGAKNTDNIVHDVTVDPATGHTVSTGGFGHPTCDAKATTVANNLPNSDPVGPNP